MEPILLDSSAVRTLLRLGVAPAQIGRLPDAYASPEAAAMLCGLSAKQLRQQIAAGPLDARGGKHRWIPISELGLPTGNIMSAPSCPCAGRYDAAIEDIYERLERI